jgi:pseudaminic acid cytidylyltransferase
MIEYAIEAAVAAAVFDDIVVSTDDPEIAEIARGAGARVPFARPAELSDDHVPTVPVIAHAIREMLRTMPALEAVCCIYPCVPLLQPEDLIEALRLLGATSAAYVFPVAAFPSPIQRALRRGGDGTTLPFFPEYASTRTQDLEASFHDAGQFYWGTTAAWLAGLNIHTNGRTIVLPEWRVIDIDTPDDWQRAEALYRTLAVVP